MAFASNPKSRMLSAFVQRHYPWRHRLLYKTAVQQCMEKYSMLVIGDSYTAVPGLLYMREQRSKFQNYIQIEFVLRLGCYVG